MGVLKSGGEGSYVYDAASSYSSDELIELSPKVVTTSQRDPLVGKLDKLFSKEQKPLKRIGIVIFESTLQPTRGGLAGNDQIYLNEAGKQILTENLFKIWEDGFTLLASDLDYVPTKKIKKSRGFSQYGAAEDDFVLSKRSTLAPDDIFFLESGKKTTSTTVVNARGMRDMSFIMVPAYELMEGPKWSEHNKQFINDVAKDLKLDAVIIVMSELSWTAAHTDKNSGDFTPEEITVKVKASTLIPLHLYHERLEALKMNEKPGVTLCYRAYETKLKIPALISLPRESQNFTSIQNEVLSPMIKTYKDASLMTIMRIADDLKKTW